MKVRWIILGLAGFVVVAAWAAMAVVYVAFEPTLAQWTALVTFAALSTEGFLWVAAGVLGWSFLAKRREMLKRLTSKATRDLDQTQSRL